jgi:hypothetical protein
MVTAYENQHPGRKSHGPRIPIRALQPSCLLASGSVPKINHVVGRSSCYKLAVRRKRDSRCVILVGIVELDGPGMEAFASINFVHADRVVSLRDCNTLAVGRKHQPHEVRGEFDSISLLARDRIAKAKSRWRIARDNRQRLPIG